MSAVLQALCGKGLFRGESSVDQLIEMIKVLGSFEPEDIDAMSVHVHASIYRKHQRGRERTCVSTHARTRARTHAGAHAHTHTQTHARTHARTQARTHARTGPAPLGMMLTFRASRCLHAFERGSSISIWCRLSVSD